MRIFITLVLALVILTVVPVVWLTLRTPTAQESQAISDVLASTAPADQPQQYSHCAACHLDDGSGRPDGAIPRLAGQRRAVIENQLSRLRSGMIHLPVMQPLARTLSAAQSTVIATYLSELAVPSPTAPIQGHDRGKMLYARHCASCHGVNAEGQDARKAHRLCGQHARYLNRRLDEISAHTRGASDDVMAAMIADVPAQDRRLIVDYVANGLPCLGSGDPAPGSATP
ncbi:MAG: cytochrome c553 [Hyphomicrobiaceae bacterium]|jgi:cytochrome c553